MAGSRNFREIVDWFLLDWIQSKAGDPCLWPWLIVEFIIEQRWAKVAIEPALLGRFRTGRIKPGSISI
jgi:hypothetical protein